MKKPKILFWDIETAPNTAYIWGLWNEVTSMDFIRDNWYVLCWSAKWLGEKKIMSAAINGPGENDESIIKKLWDLLNQADIIVAHNGVKFDCRKANTRFIKYGLNPPTPSKVIDTLKEARKYFYFTSNRLGDLGKILGVGEKAQTGGFNLWKQCMNGDKKAWNKMVKYCKQDTRLLENVYLKLRPYMTNHPNIGVINGAAVCPKCGSYNIQYRGYTITSANKYRRFQCQECGGWGKESTKIKQNKTLRNT